MTARAARTDGLRIVAAQRDTACLSKLVGQHRLDPQRDHELRFAGSARPFDRARHGEPAALALARIVQRDELDLQFARAVEGAMRIPQRTGLDRIDEARGAAAGQRL